MRLTASACCLLGSVVLAQSDAPTQIHIGLAGQDAQGRSDGMVASWQTKGATDTSIVMWGESPQSLDKTASGTCATYLPGDDEGSFSHHAIMTGLSPSTSYFYKVGDATAGFSDVMQFKSSPAATDDSTISFMLWGDMGAAKPSESNQSIELIRQFHKEGRADFMLHVGDISYADDYLLVDPLKFGYEQTWNTFMDEMSPVASRLPYMVLPGNHEAQCHSPSCILETSDRGQRLTNFTAYNARFRMPSPETDGVMNMWFSYNYGPVHFVHIDTETDFPGAPMDSYVGLETGGFGRQMDWLAADLAKASSPEERKLRPVIIVAGHRPVYSVDSTDGHGNPAGSARSLQAAIEPLMLQHNVTLYLCGHKHSYELHWPVADGQLVQRSFYKPRTPVYMVQGAGGNIESYTSYSNDPAPSWGRYWEGTYWGVGLMTVNRTAVSWEMYSAANGSVTDTMLLTLPSGL